jgi:hypothetical protein
MWKWKSVCVLLCVWFGFSLFSKWNVMWEMFGFIWSGSCS